MAMNRRYYSRRYAKDSRKGHFVNIAGGWIRECLLKISFYICSKGVNEHQTLYPAKIARQEVMIVGIPRSLEDMLYFILSYSGGGGRRGKF